MPMQIPKPPTQLKYCRDFVGLNREELEDDPSVIPDHKSMGSRRIRIRMDSKSADTSSADDLK